MVKIESNDNGKRGNRSSGVGGALRHSFYRDFSNPSKKIVKKVATEMEKVLYACPSCKKVYKHNGKWIRKHMIEVCHCKSLNPLEFQEGVNLTFLKEFILKEIQKALKVSNSTISNRKMRNSHKQVKPTIPIAKSDNFTSAFAEVMKIMNRAFNSGNLLPSEVMKYERQLQKGLIN